MPSDDITIPALLRVARAAYADSVVGRLDRAGFDDLPRNGAFVLAGVARYGESLGPLVQEMGVSRQAVSQLIDGLVQRDYLRRRQHADDRRRMVLELTTRGRRAAAIIRSAVADVDGELAGRVSARDLAGFRRSLAVLGDIKGDLRRGR